MKQLKQSGSCRGNACNRPRNLIWFRMFAVHASRKVEAMRLFWWVSRVGRPRVVAGVIDQHGGFHAHINGGQEALDAMRQALSDAVKHP